MRKERNEGHRKAAARNLYVQANYRFVVSDAVNASLHHADADRMFEWEDVLQVSSAEPLPLLV